MIFTGAVFAIVLAACALTRCYLDRSSRRDEVFLGGRAATRTVRNHGGGFGLRLGGRALAVSSAAALGVTLARSLRERRLLPRLGAGLLLGGGVSNLTERLRRGWVYDYVQFPRAFGNLKRLVFNLADFAILLGGLLLVLTQKRKKP